MNDDLLNSILARTSGSPCAAARGRLADFVDGALETVDSELVGLHLDRCTECRALASSVKALTVDLPSLAEVRPDAAFVADVLALTRPRPSRILEALAGIWRRPRIAWEAAYVGTFALALLFGVPGSPLAGVPGQALELATTNPIVAMRGPVADLQSSVAQRVGGVRRSWDEVSQDVRTSSETLTRNLQRSFGTLVGDDASEQAEDAPNDDTNGD